jgi:hypothetical protein
VHGIVLSELKKYSDWKFGPAMWPRLLREAHIDWKIYMPIRSYPDEDANAIIEVAAQISGHSTAETLENFGEFIAPRLLSMYASLKKPEWRTLDVIEHTENVIHTVVRAREAGAQPPHLQCTRVSPTEVRMIYDSPRRMCALAKGIAKGLGRLYNERIEIREPQCMMNGAPNCEMFIKTV